MSWSKILSLANVSIFKMSHGRLGSRLGRQSVLLLNTTGRRTGKHYATTLSYYRDGEAYLVVGSNWGKETQPDWYLNLLQQLRTTIQVGSTSIEVVARPADETEYQRLWELIAPKNGQYIRYQKGITRRIPIVILTPVRVDSSADSKTQ